MMLVSAATLVDAGVEVGDADDATADCKDFLVDLRTGKLTDAILTNGLVVDVAAIEWQPDATRFQVAGLPLVGGHGQAWPREASSDRGRGGEDGERRGRISSILLSELYALPLRGARGEEGDRADLGDLGGGFVDIANRRVAFVTTAVGGVLGIGAESKAVPWASIDITWSDTDELVAAIPLTEERLENAPTAEDLERSIVDPQYRDRVYSWFGVDRPAADRLASHADDLFTIREWIGVQVATVGEERVTVEDVLISPKKDSALFLRLDNGLLVPADTSEWSTTEDGRRVLRIQRDRADSEVEDLVSGSQLLDATVIAGGLERGSVANLWCLAETDRVAFVTVEIGTTLGFGGAVHALPWSVFRVETREGEAVLATKVPADRLKDAPKITAEPSGSIYSPAFRDRVEQFAQPFSGGR